MIFSTIKDYPGYVVTVDGEVYSIKRQKPYRLIGHVDRNGYRRIELCNEGKAKYIFVHRLVAEAFIPNPENKPYINHKDENKLNNAVTNLEWCTTSENNNYGTRLVRIAESKKKKIVQVNSFGNVVKTWDSQTDAAKYLHLDKRNINQCLKGRRKRCGGYEWRYLHD